MPLLADRQESVLESLEIRDSDAHYTDWVSAAWLDGVTFFIDSTLDQDASCQLQGHRIQSETRPIDVGSPITVSSGGDSGVLGAHRARTDTWLFQYRVKITCSTPPTSGSIAVWAIEQLRVVGT